MMFQREPFASTPVLNVAVRVKFHPGFVAAIKRALAKGIKMPRRARVLKSRAAQWR